MAPDASPRRARHPDDREILRLAIPAFGALVAEPMYLLADTAIVGRLGTRPLAALGIAAAVLTAAFSVFNFLAYGTTAAVARSVGAGNETEASRAGVAGLWVAAGLGGLLAAVGIAATQPIVAAMGASAAVAPMAESYLRISFLGAPAVLLALAGTGFLRGTQNTRTPLVIAVASNGLNLALEIVLVFGLDLGIAGSAWGTVVAQWLGAGAYLTIQFRRARTAGTPLGPDRAAIRATLTVGGHLVLRTAALLVAFTTAAALAARVSDAAVAAHQVAAQLWMFLAFALDALAIAAQAIVGRALGAGDFASARARSHRILRWGVGAGGLAAILVVAARPLLAEAFSDSRAVRDELLAVLVVVALTQPIGAAVFVLDGILIGAGESRYLAGAMAIATALYLPVVLLVSRAGGDLTDLWIAFNVFLVARLVGMARRYRSNRWLR